MVYYNNVLLEKNKSNYVGYICEHERVWDQETWSALRGGQIL